MAHEIGTRLTVDGEQEYKRAIKEASKSISEMGAQLTLATAQFKADGDAMKLMSSRSKVLKEEIKQQQAIVKSLEGAVKEVTDRYGENSKETEKWEAQLARAQSKLLNLQTELENNDKGLDKNGKAFDKDAQQAQKFGAELTALDKIQQSTTFQALNTALQNVENGFKTALSKGKEFAKYIWGEAVDASNRADTIATEADKLGITPQEYRAWQYAAEIVDTSVDAIVKSTDKMLNRSKDVTQAMKDMGIHTKDLFVDENGNELIVQKTRIDLFWETIEALEKMPDAYAQEEAAQAIFGKKYADLIELMHKGRDAWDEAVDTALETAPAIDNLTTFNDSLKLLDQRFVDFKTTLAEGIAPGLTAVADAGARFLTELTKWAQSETGQEKLTELSGAISGLVSSLATEENFNAVISTATGVVTGFTDAVGWIKTHQAETVTAIGAIGAAFGAIKIGSAVITTLSLINQIKWLEVAKGASALGGFGGNGGNGSGTSAPTVTNSGYSRTLSEIPKIFKDTESSPASTPQTTQKTFDLGAKAAEFIKGLPEMLAISAPFALMFDSIRQSYETQMRAHDWLGNAQAYAEERTKEVAALQGDESFETLKSVWQRLSDAISTGDATKSGNFLFDFASMYDQWAYEDFPELDAVFDNISEETADKFTAMMEQALNGENIDPYAVINLLNEIMEQLDAEITKQAAENEKNGEEIGEAVSEGVASGIDAGIPAAVEASGRLASAVLAELKSKLQIASPSKVTRGLGQFVGEGFALGIDDAQDKVTAAINRMASINTPRRAAAAFAGGAYDGRTYHSSRSLYIDKYNQYSGTDVQELMDALDAETRYTNQGMGA